jgi:hypothetical protein
MTDVEALRMPLPRHMAFRRYQNHYVKELNRARK